jgi:hypothetical protein
LGKSSHNGQESENIERPKDEEIVVADLYQCQGENLEWTREHLELGIHHVRLILLDADEGTRRDSVQAYRLNSRAVRQERDLRFKS